MDDAFDISVFGDQPLPLVLRPKRITPRSALLEAIVAHRDALKERLLEHGGLLFRGFPLESADDFADVSDALALGGSLGYIGGDSPRTKIKRGVYTSTEAPPGVKIPVHNELSFVRDHPKHILFFCQVAPRERGETILADARAVYAAIDPSVRERFLQRQLRYVSCYYGRSALMEGINRLQPSHKSWREVFETEDPRVVADLCRSHDFELHWHDDNWLRISQTRPAAITHPTTGEWVWFSQAHLYDFNPRLLGFWRYLGASLLYARKHMRMHEVFFADGERIPRENLYHLLDTLDACTIAFPWQRGDVLVLDNVLSMHGRATFQGPRRILASMTG